MSDLLDIDQAIALLSELAEANGETLSHLEATALCLHMLKNGDLPAQDRDGQPVELPPGLKDAAFLDDIVARINRRLKNSLRARDDAG